MKPRIQHLIGDLFWSCETADWSYSRMRAISVVACPAKSVSSDRLFVLPMAELASCVDKALVRTFGVHKGVLELFERYVRLSQTTETVDAAACLKLAVADVLRQLHLVPSVLLASIGQLIRWLKGEITFAAAALITGVRWGLKTLALWGARAIAILTGSNLVVASLFIFGGVLVARVLARAILGV